MTSHNIFLSIHLYFVYSSPFILHIIFHPYFVFFLILPFDFQVLFSADLKKFESMKSQDKPIKRQKTKHSCAR